MAENKMEQVAKMFGKRIGEIFYVQGASRIKHKCIFTDRGVEVLGESSGRWHFSETLFVLLMNGDVEIVEDVEDKE